MVHIINTGTSRDPQAMGLMRCLHFIAARFNLLLSATHIAGIANPLADALSHDNLLLFFKHHPQANCSPSPIPPALLNLLARLDIALLEQQVQHYLQSALSKNTMRSYTSSHRRYTSFCSTSGTTRPFPTSESILCQFVAYLAQQHLKHQTIKCYLSGIRFYQIIQSHPDPFITNMPKLQYVLRGIKSEEAKKD